MPVKDKVLQRGDSELGRTHKNGAQFQPPDSKILSFIKFFNNFLFWAGNPRKPIKNTVLKSWKEQGRYKNGWLPSLKNLPQGGPR
jgi:hypothetical protein